MPSARGHGSLASKSLVELMEERSRETKSEKVSYFAGPFDRSGFEEGIQEVLPNRSSTFRIRMVECGSPCIEVNLAVAARNKDGELSATVDHTFKDSCPSEAVFRLGEDLREASLRFTATNGTNTSEKMVEVKRDQEKWEDIIELHAAGMDTVKIALDIEEQPFLEQSRSFLAPKAQYAHKRLSWSTYHYGSTCCVRLECDTPRFPTSLQELVRTCLRECPQLQELRLPVPVEAPVGCSSAAAVQAYMERLALKHCELIAKAESVSWTDGRKETGSLCRDCCQSHESRPLSVLANDRSFKMERELGR